MNQLTRPSIGHIFGPPVPHIAFYYGERYLGETRGHPDRLEEAREKLAKFMQLKMFWPEMDSNSFLINAAETRAKLVCGPVSQYLDNKPFGDFELEQTEDLPNGFSRQRPPGAVKYVMMLVFSADRQKAIGLLKQKGPTFLIGKVTYPGGRIEDGETLETTASREMLEETGVMIAPEKWSFLAASDDVAVFTATADVTLARTMEVEPVFTFDVKGQLAMAEMMQGMFAPDFVQLTKAALTQ